MTVLSLYALLIFFVYTFWEKCMNKLLLSKITLSECKHNIYTIYIYFIIRSDKIRLHTRQENQLSM